MSHIPLPPSSSVQVILQAYETTTDLPDTDGDDGDGDGLQWTSSMIATAGRSDSGAGDPLLGPKGGIKATAQLGGRPSQQGLSAAEGKAASDAPGSGWGAIKAHNKVAPEGSDGVIDDHKAPAAVAPSGGSSPILAFPAGQGNEAAGGHSQGAASKEEV